MPGAHSRPRTKGRHLDHRDTRTVETLARLAAAATLVAAVLVLSAYPFDDAFIHLRLARHLALHGEPYFNPGDRVMTGSSPLWMLWLAGWFRVLGTTSAYVAVVTACLVIVALFVTCEAVLARGRRSALTVAAAFIVAALALPSAGGLMETPLAVALLFGALWAWQSERIVLAGVLFALGGATRVEMTAPAIGALILIPGWPRKLRLLAGAGPVWLAQLVLLAVFFGAVTPQAVTAKAIVYQLRPLDLLSMGPQEFGSWTGAVLVAILCAATVAGLLLGRRGTPGPSSHSDRMWLLPAIFPLLLLTIYVYRAPLVFPWYWTLSVCPSAIVALAIFLDESRSSSWSTARAATATAVVSTLVLTAASLIAVASAVTGRLEGSPWLVENARTRSYQRVGAALATRCRDVVVAAPEIGALGWTFDGRILDGIGLASPEVLAFHPLRVPDERPSGGVGAIPGAAVAELRPDVLVSMEVFSTDFIQRAAVMPELAEYALWWKEPVFAADLPADHPSTLWGSEWILVFSRHRTASGMSCSA